jgi:hypothetical protein
MQLPYSVHGLAGRVDIDVGPTRSPKELGGWPGAAGLTFCEAIVSYPGRGYTGLLGWIQLVRSTDNSSGVPGSSPTRLRCSESYRTRSASVSNRPL